MTFRISSLISSVGLPVAYVLFRNCMSALISNRCSKSVNPTQYFFWVTLTTSLPIL